MHEERILERKRVPEKRMEGTCVIANSEWDVCAPYGNSAGDLRSLVPPKRLVLGEDGLVERSGGEGDDCKGMDERDDVDIPVCRRNFEMQGVSDV